MQNSVHENEAVPVNPELSMLNIIVALVHDENTAFCEAVPSALREYADAVERGNATFLATPKDALPVCGKRAVEEIITSNGCEVRVIAGSYSFLGKDHLSKAMPLASIRARTSVITEYNKDGFKVSSDEFVLS